VVVFIQPDHSDVGRVRSSLCFLQASHPSHQSTPHRFPIAFSRESEFSADPPLKSADACLDFRTCAIALRAQVRIS
jgi:hypothetical protein